MAKRTRFTVRTCAYLPSFFSITRLFIMTSNPFFFTWWPTPTHQAVIWLATFQKRKTPSLTITFPAYWLCRNTWEKGKLVNVFFFAYKHRASMSLIPTFFNPCFSSFLKFTNGIETCFFFFFFVDTGKCWLILVIFYRGTKERSALLKGRFQTSDFYRTGVTGPMLFWVF